MRAGDVVAPAAGLLRGEPPAVTTPRPTFQPETYVYETDPATGAVTRYRCGRLLGRGGFAQCYEVTAGETSYALKVIQRSSLAKPKTLQKLDSEIAIHRRMSHRHIVRFLRTFQDRHHVYILLEKCDRGTLMDLLKVRPLSVEETQYIMLQCLAAVQYMQDHFIIHRDLKPGNIMLDGAMNVKIGDFGLAAELQYDGERKRTVCGTPNYIAPEIIDRRSHGHSYEVDVWSLGVILYTLLVGEPPFQMQDVEATYRRIRACRYHIPAHLPAAARDLIQGILQSSPLHRPTLIDLRTHPFFAVPPPPLQAPASFRDFFPTRPPPTAPSSERKTAALAPREVLRPRNGNLPVAPPSATTTETKATDTKATATATATAAIKVATATATTPPPRSISPRPGARRGTEPLALPRPGLRATVEDAEDHAELTAMHEGLHRTLEGPPRRVQAAAGVDLPSPTVWVTACADFSAKYGLAYTLNTGQTGAHFNDSTKMVWEPATGRVEYYARIKVAVHPASADGGLCAKDRLEIFTLPGSPPAMEKKVTLIQYFRSYLGRSRSAREKVAVVVCSPYRPPHPPRRDDPHVTRDFVYVKRWLSTPEALIFRLSNKTVQVCFHDQEEIMLSSEWKVVTYTDASGHRQTLPLNGVAGASEAAARRLRYTKSILYQLIQNHYL